MSYLYVAQTAVPKELESEFNRLYDEEHLPNLLQVKGLTAARRYKKEWGDAEMAEYLAVYDVEDPNLPKTAEWKAASDKGDWSVKIRPHLTVRSHGMFRSR